MDFAVPADTKENKRKQTYRQLPCQRVEHENDGDTNCCWCP